MIHAIGGQQRVTLTSLKKKGVQYYETLSTAPLNYMVIVIVDSKDSWRIVYKNIFSNDLLCFTPLSVLLFIFLENFWTPESLDSFSA